jgi:hypothetical protein
MTNLLVQYSASISGLFRMIIILFLIYEFFRLFVRYIFPSLIKHFVNEFQKQNQNPHSQSNEPIRKEGTITIKSMESNPKKENSDHIGEYVDYEEVK